MATGYDPKDAARRDPDLDRNNDGRVDSADRPRDHDHDRDHSRVVAHDRVAPAADPTLTKEVRRDAYERGRADERSRHKRNPLITVLIALAAVFGLAVIALYIYNGGSFTETGRDLDEVTARTAQEAREAGSEVVDETGEGLQDVGRRVEQTGESGQRATPEPRPAPQRP